MISVAEPGSYYSGPACLTEKMLRGACGSNGKARTHEPGRIIPLRQAKGYIFDK